MNDPFRLRAHHLGCVPGFTGHGYDRVFTDRLAAIASALAADPTHPILVVQGADDVCASCPHRDGTRCIREPSADAAVNAHDAAFLRALSLAPGDLVTPAAVRDRIDRSPAIRKALRDACTGCPWTGVCTFFRDVLGRTACGTGRPD